MVARSEVRPTRRREVEMRGACVSARCSREERIRVSTVRASLAGRANAYSRIMHSATVRGVHRPSVSNELNCTGKRAGVREWKGRPCLCRESHEPGPQPRASTLHRGGAPRVTRTRTRTRARTRIVSREPGPAVELSRSGLRPRCRRSRA